MKRLAAAFAVLLFLSGLAQAQTSYGSVVGTVTDATRGAIPGTPVTLTNTGTGERRMAPTDAVGNFQFVNLIPGTYRLQVESPGFKRYNREPIRVEVESSVRIDPILEVGDVAEELTVSAETPLLQTQTATLGQTVEGRIVQDMPLNGRNVLNLVALAPGVVPQGSTSGSPLGNQAGGTYTNNTGWGNYQIGGGMSNQSAFYLDGVPLNTVNANSPGLVPVQDAIQEFRVDSNAVSAEFGRFSGGVVNMASKSGTNQFHGTVYEYLRNKVLNANDFFNNRSGVKRNAFTQNQYGAAASGPIVKDKAFFFFSWENFGLRNGRPTLTTVPTAAMKAGDFTGLPPIYDPYSTCGLQGLPACPNGQPTRTPFAQNIIPASRIDSTAKVLMNVWGAPNLPGNVNNFAGNTSLGGNQTQETIRGDYTFKEKHRLFGRFTYWDGTSLPSDPFQKSFGGLKTLYGADDAVAGDTFTVSPSIVLDFRVSYLRALHAFRPQQTGTDLSQYGPAWAVLGSQVTLPEAPLPNVTGFAAFSGVYIQSVSNEYFLSGGATKIAGRHTLKFGGEARRWDWGFVQSNTAAGSFNFNNVFTSANPLSPGSTGYAFASYLLGTPASGSLAGAARVLQQIYYQGYYVTDSYRVTNRLTLNVGVRLDVDGSFSERFDRTVVWQPGAADPLGQTVGMNFKGQLAFVNTPAYPDRHQLGSSKVLAAPRVGIAWSAARNTVIRTGYGLSWVSPEQINYSLPPFQSAINAATTTMVTSANGGLTPLNTLSNPFPGGLIQPLNNNPAGLTRFEGQSFNAPIPGQPFTSVQQWNFQVQHQFADGLSLDLGYAGSKATHLAFSVIQINKLADQYLSMGAGLLNPVANPFYGVLPSSAGTLGLPTVTAEQLLRPYPQFLNLGDSAPQKGDSTYHALQMRLVKRFRSGGTIQASYTWSKLLSDTDTLTSWLEAGHGVGGVQNPSNLRLEKSLASFDAANRLVVSYVYDLPVGKGRHFLGGLHGPADRLLSGWGIGGITTFQSGLPLALTTASNLTSSLGGGSRPNVVNSNVAIIGPAQGRLGQWFNTAAFAQPAAFTFGSESRTDPVLRAAGINNFDFTVVKRTAINERFRLEFRTEFFNLFNRVQFADPGTSLGSPQFGIVTSAMNLPRLAQLGLRLSF
ncbi:MAG: hypothetical protein C5B51_11840 [Terriglobia bacterium]|nr:MAG: hypothetical protein C5B51_11840 [Terriglobia bacterium]